MPIFSYVKKFRHVGSRDYWDFGAVNSHKGVKNIPQRYFFLFLKILSAVRTMADLVVFGMGGQWIKIPFTT